MPVQAEPIQGRMELEMRRIAIYLLAICSVLSAEIRAAQSSEKEKAALTAAEEWLSMVDEGNHGQSWKGAAEYFRNAVSEEQWVQTLKAVRDPMGKLVAREVRSTSYETSLPGAPDGEYVVIQFITSFENKQAAVETVTPMLDKDGTWRVSGYYIK